MVSGLAGYVGNDFEKYLLSNDRYNEIGYRFTGFNKQSFCYGADIPIVYGRVLLSGNIVWYGEVREERHTKVREFGNIFQHKEYNDHYKYYASFAIILCAGKVDQISRIWADEEEVFLNHLNLKVYLGAEDQGIDPLIASHLGEENTSAFRGLCYVVIKDFPIDAVRSTLPKFTFEVKRKISQSRIMNKFNAINLGPGYGEYAYETRILYKKYYSKFEKGIIYHTHKDPLNLNASNIKSDVLVSLDHMREQYPNIKWITLNVAWFTDSTDIKNAKIYPTMEFKEGQYTHPIDWTVSSYNRQNAKLALRDNKGKFIYGGTPSDNSLIDLVRELKSRGYKVVISPLLLVENEAKTWRGNMSGSLEHFDKFYDDKGGYTEFITHYAHLLKEQIDGFILGSELVGLNNSSKGLQKLINLARKVKSIFAGRDIKLTYGADVSEYLHLRELWRDPSIDVIGINAFFTDGFKDDFSILNPEKSIWFTQFGFPSISECVKTPKYSKDSQLNNGEYNVDFLAQERALSENFDKWKSNARIENIFLYYYDINPNIHLVEYLDQNWPYNHSLNFKSTNIGIAEIMQDLSKNLPERDLIEFDLYNQYFYGAIIKDIKNYYDFLQILTLTLNFHFYEKNGKLIITNKIHSSTKKTLEENSHLFIGEETLSYDYIKISNVRVTFINIEKDYTLDYQDNYRGSGGMNLNIFFPFIINQAFIAKLSDNIFNRHEKCCTQYKILLPYQFYHDFDFTIRSINKVSYLLFSKKITEDNIVELSFQKI